MNECISILSKFLFAKNILDTFLSFTYIYDQIGMWALCLHFLTLSTPYRSDRSKRFALNFPRILFFVSWTLIIFFYFFTLSFFSSRRSSYFHVFIVLEMDPPLPSPRPNPPISSTPAGLLGLSSYCTCFYINNG